MFRIGNVGLELGSGCPPELALVSGGPRSIVII